jgi:hypothetical protein
MNDVFSMMQSNLTRGYPFAAKSKDYDSTPIDRPSPSLGAAKRMVVELSFINQLTITTRIGGPAPAC